MMLRRARLGALVGLLLCSSNIVAAAVIDPLLWQRDGTTSTAVASTTTTDAASTAAAAASSTTAVAASSTEGSSDSTTITSATAASASATDATNTTSSSATATTATTSATSSLSLNETLYNSTITAGELPITPVLTPGWGVAGIILILTGAVYGLVGIKKRWLHTFFSTAYLASLGTAVLIVYVMSPPVSDAVQGAYVVAVVCTGLILGGIFTLFKEITEGLGCMLGGFCLSMWLMCLHEGGLVQNDTGKVIFIVAFTVVAFSFSFTHWTREYALIVCVSFAGATIVVLGIDAFSRAGLKEFWAYIWNLNDNLFPLGADTYPLTKGIRVELAVNIILFLAGIISQMKLWRIVQERRAKRDAARAEDERNLQEEEANVGRQIEDANARDRQVWEATYGDGTPMPPRSSENESAADSGLGDMESEKKVPHSTTVQLSRQVEGSDETETAGDSIELAELEASRPKEAAEMVMEQDGENGQVTVHVAQDDYPEGAPPTEAGELGEMAASATKHMSAQGQRSIRRVSKDSTVPPSAPEVVPLPFKIPGAEAGEEADAEGGNRNDNDDRSSVATFADEDEVIPTLRRRGSLLPETLAKRLSQGSVEVFRSLSQRSKRASGAQKNADGIAGESSEGLVTSPLFNQLSHNDDVDRDDNSSIAATIDGISSDGDDMDRLRGDETAGVPSQGIELNAQLSDSINAPARPASPTEAKDEALAVPKQRAAETRPRSTDTLTTEALGGGQSASGATDTAPEKGEGEDAATSRAPSRQAQSVASTALTPVNLTKAHLPRSLSRVALSYRTNEWAKHLSHADTPEPESLQVVRNVLQPASPISSEHDASSTEGPEVDEAPARVNVAELQQTAENGTPPVAAPRTASAMSSYVSAPSVGSPSKSVPRSVSHQSLTAQDVARNSFSRSVSANHITRRESGLRHEAIVEENDAEREVHTEPEQSTSEEATTPTEETTPTDSSVSQNRQSSTMLPIPGVVSFSSPQTLIGRRDMLLRSKTQSGMYIGGPVVNSESMTNLGGVNRSSTLPVIPSSGISDNGGGSVYSYHTANLAMPGAGGPPSPVDLDDLPMSQRKELMRHNSYLSIVGGRHSPGAASPSHPMPNAENVHFDSHQPKRGQSHLPTSAARQAQLATFRNSVAAELRTHSPATANASNLRESVSNSFLAGSSTSPSSAHDVQHAIDKQRQYLMSQKEAESQRRYIEKQDKERNDRAFETLMRRGDLIEAHRDAMRRMQASARDS